MYSAQFICKTFEFAGGAGNNFRLDPGQVYTTPGGGQATIELAQ